MAVIEILSGSFIGIAGTVVVDKCTADPEDVLFLRDARAVSKCRVTLTVLPAGNFVAQAAISADGSPVAALNSAIVLSGKTPSFTVCCVV